MTRITLACAGETVRLACADAAFAREVAAILHPAFRADAADALPAVAAVEVRLAEGDPPAPDRGSPRLVIAPEAGLELAILRHHPGHATLLRAAEPDSRPVLLEVDRAAGTWTVTAWSACGASARGVARTVKQLFGHLVRARGCPVAHASAVERGGRAVLLAGEKGSGKSTLMLRACTELGMRFVSDDLVVFWSGGDGELRCGGWPKRVSVPLSALRGAETRERLAAAGSRRGGWAQPPLAADDFAHRPPSARRRLQLDADEFLRRFGIRAADAATPAAILLPVFDPHAEGRWSLHRVERAPAGVLWAGEKHLRLFDDHLGLAPAPRGALTPADAVARVEALPTWALTCGTLSPADLETIFDRVTDPSR